MTFNIPLMTSHITDKTKEKIIQLNSLGKTITSISKIVKRPYITIYNIVKKIKNNGCLKRKSGTGRKKLFLKNDVKGLLKEVDKNGKRPSKDLFIASDNRFQSKLSCSTIRRILKENGYKSRICAKKPLLSVLHKAKRLQLTKKFLKHPPGYWSNVIFSDESTFRLCGVSGNQKVWRKVGMRYLEKNIIHTEKFGGGGIMVWGYITMNGPGDLVFIDGNMNQYEYKKYLKPIYYLF